MNSVMCQTDCELTFTSQNGCRCWQLNRTVENKGIQCMIQLEVDTTSKSDSDHPWMQEDFFSFGKINLTENNVNYTGESNGNESIKYENVPANQRDNTNDNSFEGDEDINDLADDDDNTSDDENDLHDDENDLHDDENDLLDEINLRKDVMIDNVELHTGNEETELHTGNAETELHTGNAETELYTGNEETELHTGNNETELHTGNNETELHAGNDETELHTGNDETELHTGNDETELHTGNDEAELHKGNDETELKITYAEKSISDETCHVKDNHQNFENVKSENKSMGNNQYDSVQKDSKDEESKVKPNGKHKCHICGNEMKLPCSLRKHLKKHEMGKKVQCESCNKKFFFRWELTKHMTVHTKHLEKEDKTNPDIKQHKCHICGKEMKLQCSLRKHIKKHKMEKKVQCNYCDMKFFYQYELNQHMPVHSKHQDSLEETSVSDVQTHKCHICGKEMKLQCSLRKHLKKHQIGKQFQCECCGKEFFYRGDLNQHMLSRHPHSELTKGLSLENECTRSWICHTCGKKMTSKSILRKHVKRHTMERKFQCETCGRKFCYQSELNLHQTAHLTLMDSHVCHICGKRLTRGDSLRKHVRRHGERNQSCHICKKNFLFLNELNRHLKFHSNKKEYQCAECGKFYKTEINLQIHMALHREKTIICQICGKSFHLKGALYSHLRHAHEGIPYPSTLKRQNRESMITCDICGKQFIQKCALKNHYRTHTGEKPFICQTCDKQFYDNRLLNQHINSIHLKKYHCHICNKNFTCNRNVKRHMKSVH